MIGLRYLSEPNRDPSELWRRLLNRNYSTVLKGDFLGHPFRGNQWTDNPSFTPQFNAWFRGSIAVDKNGEPARFFHATHGKDFKSFLPLSHFGSARQAQDRLDFLDKVQGRSGFPMMKATRVIPVFLSVKKPFRLPDLGNFENKWGWIGPLREAGFPTSDSTDKPSSIPEMIEMLRGAGYDSIVYTNHTEGARGKKFEDSYIIFDPNQAKSVFNPKPTRAQQIAKYDENQPRDSHGRWTDAAWDSGTVSVYHGSPAEYDQVDLSMVGTGQGAASYGWGHYVSTVGGVGDSYREQYRKPLVTLKGNRYSRQIGERDGYADGADDWRAVHGALQWVAQADAEQTPDKETLIARARRNLMSLRPGFYEHGKKVLDEEDQRINEAIDRQVALLDTLKPGDITVEKPGAFYEQEIPAKGYIDWDANWNWIKEKEPEVYRAIESDMELWIPLSVHYQTREDALAVADRQEIDGVLKEPYHVRMVTTHGSKAGKYCIYGPPHKETTGQDYYNQLAGTILQEKLDPEHGKLGTTPKEKKDSYKEASQRLAKAGIVGHKFIGTTSEAVNYVIYDDKWVRVRRRTRSRAEYEQALDEHRQSVGKAAPK